MDVSGPAEAVHSMKQNVGVLSDLQFFNKGPGPSQDVGRRCLGRCGQWLTWPASILEPSPLVGKYVFQIFQRPHLIQPHGHCFPLGFLAPHSDLDGVVLREAAQVIGHSCKLK